MDDPFDQKENTIQVLTETIENLNLFIKGLKSENEELKKTREKEKIEIKELEEKYMEQSRKTEKLTEINEEFKKNNTSMLSTLELMLDLVETRNIEEDETEFWREWYNLQDILLLSKGNLLSLLNEETFLDEYTWKSTESLDPKSRTNSRHFSVPIDPKIDTSLKVKGRKTCLPLSAGAKKSMDYSTETTHFYTQPSSESNDHDLYEQIVYPITPDLEIVADLKRCSKKKTTRVCDVSFVRGRSNRNSMNLEDNPEVTSNIVPNQKPPFNPPLVKNFFIAGISKSCLPANKQLNSKMTFDPQLLYISDDKETQDYINQYQITSFPGKVNLTRISDMITLNKIVYFQRIQYNLLENLYYFNLLDPLSTQLNINVANPALKKLNPHCMRYIYCLKMKDYLAFPSLAKEKGKKYCFHGFDKLLCFVTYFPFTIAFFQVLLDIADKMKKMRDELIGNDESLAAFAIADSDALINAFKNNTQGILDCINSLTFQDVLILEGNFSFKIDKFVYKNSIEPAEKFVYAAVTTFKNICPDTFKLLYFILLTEHTLVIHSQYPGIVSSIIFTLLNCLSPFIWPHFFNYFITPEFEPIIQGNIPILAGICYNQNYEGLKEKASSVDNVVFYDNDQCEFKGECNVKKNMSDFLPRLDKNSQTNFQTLMRELNPNKKYHSDTKLKFLGLINALPIPNEPSYPSLNNVQEKKIAISIIKSFHEMNSFISEKLSSMKISAAEYPGNLNFVREEAKKLFTHKKDKDFIKKFTETGIFDSFIQDNLIK